MSWALSFISEEIDVFPKDTVVSELHRMAMDLGESLPLALYMLGFGTYNGFKR